MATLGRSVIRHRWEHAFCEIVNSWCSWASDSNEVTSVPKIFYKVQSVQRRTGKNGQAVWKFLSRSHILIVRAGVLDLTGKIEDFRGDEGAAKLAEVLPTTQVAQLSKKRE